MSYIIIFAFCTACLAHFFQMTQKEGMIFEWYGDFLERIPEFIAKPLGKCVLCNGAWIFIILYFWQHCPPCGDKKFVLFLLFGIGVNYICTEIIGQIIKE